MNFWDVIFAPLVRLFALRYWRQPRLTILVYHRVLDRYDPLRPDVVTRAQFDAQIGWAKKHFRVLSLAEAVAGLQNNNLPQRALAITFDDGYRDNLTNALPVLQKHDARASFFIACNYLQQLPKWDFLTEAIRHTPLREVDFLDVCYPLLTEANKQAFALAAPELIKQFPEDQADHYLADLIENLGPTDVPDLMLNSADLLELQKAGMDIGAHSVSHVILSRVTKADANQEITQSKQLLEHELRETVRGFAYPNGLYPIDLTDEHIGMVEKAGYEYAVTTNIGCSHSYSERFALKRFTPWRRTQFGFLAELCVNLWRD